MDLPAIISFRPLGGSHGGWDTESSLYIQTPVEEVFEPPKHLYDKASYRASKQLLTRYLEDLLGCLGHFLGGERWCRGCGYQQHLKSSRIHDLRAIFLLISGERVKISTERKQFGETPPKGPNPQKNIGWSTYLHPERTSRGPQKKRRIGWIDTVETRMVDVWNIFSPHPYRKDCTLYRSFLWTCRNGSNFKL